MKFYSTLNRRCIVSARQAVIKGIADDGGLFMPVEIPAIPKSIMQDLPALSFLEISFQIAQHFFGDELSSENLNTIVTDALNFPVPLVSLDNGIHILELFHGPTLAFKDFGARFMARLLSCYTQNDDRETTVLVATSGDTGSAVANGFYNQPGIRVILLYPSGMVSEIQEKQLTTYSGNVQALEVEGTFDDCQRLVKSAFLDTELKASKKLSSANSINIARLIPQSFYYFHAFGQVKSPIESVFYSVPSGNLGNLTAGILASKMGLPVAGFIASLNVNKTFLRYLESGNYKPGGAIATLSNAMDVGDPSNFERISALYDNDSTKMNKEIYAASFNDDQTREAIGEIYGKYNYIMDPHGAVGYLGLIDFIAKKNVKDYQGIVFETAHPAKFSEAVNEELNFKVDVPDRLKECLTREKKSIRMSTKFNDFKEFLLRN